MGLEVPSDSSPGQLAPAEQRLPGHALSHRALMEADLGQPCPLLLGAPGALAVCEMKLLTQLEAPPPVVHREFPCNCQGYIVAELFFC